MKNSPMETIEYRGFKIEVYYDWDPMNPITDWDMLGKFVCFHKKYDLSNDQRFKSPDELMEYVKENKCRLYPLYLYDHSGITISLSPFSCRWDSGQVGWVMLEPDDLRKKYKAKRLSKNHWKKAEKVIENEVKVFDDYLTGSVYGFKAFDSDGEEFDSCWGYYGDTEEMIAEVKANIDKEVDSFELQPFEREGAFV